MKLKENEEFKDFNPSKMTFWHGLSAVLLLISVILVTVAYVKWSIDYLYFSLFIFMFMTNIVRGIQLKIFGELIQYITEHNQEGYKLVAEALDELDIKIKRVTR